MYSSQSKRFNSQGQVQKVVETVRKQKLESVLSHTGAREIDQSEPRVVVSSGSNSVSPPRMAGMHSKYSWMLSFAG